MDDRSTLRPRAREFPHLSFAGDWGIPELAEVYLMQGSYSRALEHATRAEALGSPLPADRAKALQDKLRKE